MEVSVQELEKWEQGSEKGEFRKIDSEIKSREATG